jgi:pimeloyl-ACP methyl ester carboxylesterase
VGRAAPDQAILITGHSAGGVVARLFMVEHPEDRVAALITLASPHLGADTAQLGLMAGVETFAWLDAWFGTRTFSRFQSLLKDLSPEQPDNLLGWLNRQKHPAALYVSIVREADNVWEGGDLLVPSSSQDMNQVAALRGRAKTVRVRSGHELSHADGELMLHIIDSMRRT